MRRQGMIAACGLTSLVLLGAAGCQSQQSLASNPFFSSDRVPPPGTRTPAPGTAEPYYPTDQLPPVPAQSQAPAVANAPVVASASSPNPSNPTLARAATPGSAPIAVPTDNQSLRPVAAPSMVAVAPAQPIVQQPTMQQPVSPEFSNGPQPADLAWNSGAPPRRLDPAAIENAKPVAPATYVASTAPRVRLPSYGASASAAPAPTAVPVTGHVQVTELPPRPASLAPAPPVQHVASDGFQPRGTAVRRPLSPVSPTVGQGTVPGVF